MATYKAIHGVNIQYRDSDATAIEGDVWYNSATGKLKMYASLGSWASGGNYPRNMGEGGAAGTQTAALGFGGSPGTPVATAEYDGSSWTDGGDLGTGRYAQGGCGTQTAGLCVSGYAGGLKDEVEEYNGSSWSEQNDIPLAGYNMTALGTQTAAVATAARWSPYPTMKTDSYEYDGTSWTAGGAIPANRAVATAVGTQTAGLVMAGISTIPYGGFYQSCIEYDGSSWTVATGDLNRSGSMLAGGSGTQAAALIYGGLYVGGPTVLADTESYDGTSWTELNNLSTARFLMGSPSGTNTLALGFAGNAPSLTNATEEWSFSASVETVAFD